jgi:hypothetical protein
MAKKPRRKPKGVNAKVRAEDERLRETLRNADLKAFDKLIPKAMRSPVSSPRH